ncbi:hypothetical protein B0H14DRAFT_2569884 [Mycena olivaceomarginata]|nr:hypothetical protein B0H14DRAFT_2569884 [Mycena olivaceomarginata]
MRTLFAVNQWLCNIFSLAPPTISRHLSLSTLRFRATLAPVDCRPSTTPLSARFSHRFRRQIIGRIHHAFRVATHLCTRNVGFWRFSLADFTAQTVSETSSLAWGLLKLDLRRAPRMGTAWGCAHGCEAAASLPASGGTSCAFPTERGPTPLRRELPAAHPFRRAGRCAGSTSLPAPACRPTPALEQGGEQGGGQAAGARGAGSRCGWCPATRAQADLVVGSGRTAAPPALIAPPARLPARLAAREPRFRKCAREDLACGWLEVYQRGWEGVADIVGVRYFISLRNAGGNGGWNGGWKRRAGHVGAKIWHAGGIEVTQQGGRGGAERGVRDLPASLRARPRFRKCGWERRVGTAGGTRAHEI